MRPGDCAAWPAGDTNGHRFLNRTDRQARFLVVGSKAPHEVATYSDVDLVLEVKDGAGGFTYRDGAPWNGPRMNTNSSYMSELVFPPRDARPFASQEA